GSSQVRLTQPQLSITREENKTLRIDCHVSLSADFGKAPIHWYRQRPGAAPERILFISTKPEFDRVLDNGKFNAEKKIGQSTCTLTINKITSTDIATYYCAYWDRTELENCRQPLYITESQITVLQIHVNFMFSFLALFLDGCAQIHLRQAQLSVTRAETKTARMDCEASGIRNFRSAIIHWYRHRSGKAPERILYISSEKPVFDKDTDKKKFDCEKNPDQPISTLRVNAITPNDRAIYYCAYWDGTALESQRQPVQKPHSVF
ncbi:hypothetical protein G0U57_015886, partial [Chelydra serpentina]